MTRDETVKYLVGKKPGTYTFDDLCTIHALLRGEGGCPWDREQTHESIRSSFIEETYEVIEAIDQDDPEMLREELGDLLFSVVNVSRFLKQNPEHALDLANEKFISRFHAMEQLAAQAGHALQDLSLSEMDAFWEKAKSIQKVDGE